MGLETQHTQWPLTPFPDDIKDFITRFYEIADDFSEAATHTVDYLFLPDAQVTLGDQTFKGFDQLEQARSAPFPLLESVFHEIKGVYSRNEVGDDLLLYGRVTWVYKKGGERSADFASKLDLVNGEDGWRLRSYQAFADLSQLIAGLSE
ncbi:uncharacterized protein AB675_1676 [Cyphellophora attinorum]|uniref:SnoaL-like domain-containing protein n=1 Tax=Cyphellophora attinorum TaxID=1664694 RepID=A0A0N0NIS0_9EURO|nr:uncharacterized protein AB675_1676 [Phialophora attinorum]KPI36068.1 hypothetical protein AB675_1676 [Phialophora attinorum]